MYYYTTHSLQAAARPTQRVRPTNKVELSVSGELDTRDRRPFSPPFRARWPERRQTLSQSRVKPSQLVGGATGRWAQKTTRTSIRRRATSCILPQTADASRVPHNGQYHIHSLTGGRSQTNRSPNYEIILDGRMISGGGVS